MAVGVMPAVGDPTFVAAAVALAAGLVAFGVAVLSLLLEPPQAAAAAAIAATASAMDRYRARVLMLGLLSSCLTISSMWKGPPIADRRPLEVVPAPPD
jgi:hypothetical protein